MDEDVPKLLAEIERLQNNESVYIRRITELETAIRGVIK